MDARYPSTGWPAWRAAPPRRSLCPPWLVLAYDRAYRLVHRLERPMAEVGPALCLEVRRSLRERVLFDGTVIRRRDRVGILHLNNSRIVTVHLSGLPPQVVGIQFRRSLLASLRELARLAATSGGLATVRAFSATTIFHAGLARLGFQPDREGLFLPKFVAGYQRLLLASLHPRGAIRIKSETHRDAQRVWLTREALLARYGTPVVTDSATRLKRRPRTTTERRRSIRGEVPDRGR